MLRVLLFRLFLFRRLDAVTADTDHVTVRLVAPRILHVRVMASMPPATVMMATVVVMTAASMATVTTSATASAVASASATVIVSDVDDGFVVMVAHWHGNHVVALVNSAVMMTAVKDAWWSSAAGNAVHIATSAAAAVVTAVTTSAATATVATAVTTATVMATTVVSVSSVMSGAMVSDGETMVTAGIAATVNAYLITWTVMSRHADLIETWASNRCWGSKNVLFPCVAFLLWVHRCWVG